MKGINSRLALSNFKKKDKKFSSDKPTIKIEKKGSEEQRIKSKDITDVQFKLVKDHTDHKALLINILKSSMLSSMKK